MDSKDRIKLLKRGFSEKQIGELYNQFEGNIILEVDWDEA
jgi:hypothetical protein